MFNKHWKKKKSENNNKKNTTNLEDDHALTLTWQNFKLWPRFQCFASDLPGDLNTPAKHLGDLVYLLVKHLPSPWGCKRKSLQSVMNFHICIIFL